MRRFLLLSGLTYGLLFLGLATLNGGLFALAVPLAIYLLASFLCGPGEPQLKVSRTISAERVSRGIPVVVRLLITNEGPRLEEVLVEDVVPQPLEVTDGKPRVLASFPPGGTVEMEYTMTGRRGHFDFQNVRVTASDHLGLFRRQVMIPAPGQFFVMPEVLSMRRVAIRPLRTRVYAGPIPARQGGSGVEFFGLREYQLGDPRRWINWRASARYLHTLFTNEFKQEHVADVGLILDARQRRDVRVEGESLFEHAVQATASLAEVFLKDGNRVGLLVYGWHLAWTFPGCGKVQRERILRALARAKTVEDVRLDYLPKRLFPARSQLVLISPLHQNDLPVLIRLRARGYQLLVVSPDPITFEAKALGSQPEVVLATRIARLERALLFRKMQQAGIHVVDWQVDRPFDEAVPASLGQQPYWFRVVRV